MQITQIHGLESQAKWKGESETLSASWLQALTTMAPLSWWTVSWTVSQKKPFLPPFLCPSLPSSLLTFFPSFLFPSFPPSLPLSLLSPSLFPSLLKLLLSCHSNKKVTHTAAFWEWTKSFCLPFVDKFQLTLWPHLDAEGAERYFLHCIPPTSSELCKLTILVSTFPSFLLSQKDWVVRAVTESWLVETHTVMKQLPVEFRLLIPNHLLPIDSSGLSENLPRKVLQISFLTAHWHSNSC